MERPRQKITPDDMTLRDGMHPSATSCPSRQMKPIATGLDEAGVPMIEKSPRRQPGRQLGELRLPAHSDEEYLSAVIPLMKQAKVSVLLLPGIGTVDHLKMARDLGVNTIRVATTAPRPMCPNSTSRWPARWTWTPSAFLMMATEQPRRAGQAGEADGRLRRQLHLTSPTPPATCCPTASRPACRPCARLKPETEIGFHGHHNLAMGVANSIAAIEAGATRIDAAAAGLGAGAGNTPMEVLIAVCSLMGIETGVDVARITDVAEDLVVPMMTSPSASTATR